MKTKLVHHTFETMHITSVTGIASKQRHRDGDKLVCIPKPSPPNKETSRKSSTWTALKYWYTKPNTHPSIIDLIPALAFPSTSSDASDKAEIVLRSSI